MSERVRGVLRRGAVYGLAGVMTAGETLASGAKSAAQGAEYVASTAGDMAGDLVGEARQARSDDRARDRAAGVRAQKAQPRRRTSRPKAGT